MAYRFIPEPTGPYQLGDFYLEDRRFPAVYFLISNGTVVYVGQSKTLQLRIDAHITEAKKVFDSVSFIRCTIDHLLKIEGHFIRRIAPKYNDCLAAKATRAREYWRFPKLTESKTISPEEAAEYLGLTLEQMKRVPSHILTARRKRFPRSSVVRIRYNRDDLEAARIRDAKFFEALARSDAKRGTRHRNRKAA